MKCWLLLALLSGAACSPAPQLSSDTAPSTLDTEALGSSTGQKTDIKESMGTDEAATDAMRSATEILKADQTAESDLNLPPTDQAVANSDSKTVPLDAGFDGASSSDTKGIKCESLPVFCGADRCPFMDGQGKDTLYNAKAIQNLNALNKTTKLSQAFYKWFDPKAMTYWRPSKIVQINASTVRLYATWFNQYFGHKLPGVDIYQTSCEQCQAVKSSLLPTGCVQVDIDVVAGTVGSIVLDAAKPPDFMAPTGDFFTDVGCAQTIGVVPAAGTLTLTTPTGDQVVAHAGRASIHKLLQNPLADISALVRDQEGVEAPDPVTSSVLEIVRPSGEVTAVAVDASICRATPQNMIDAGCPCPAQALPTALPELPTVSWMAFHSPAFDVTVTTDYLAATEPPYWNGVGLAGPKIEFPEWPCCTMCEKSDPKWLCGGWQQTTMALPAIAWAKAGAAWSHLYGFIDMPGYAATLKGAALPFTWASANSTAVLGFVSSVIGLPLPPKQRDGAWGEIVVGAPPTVVTLSAWTANSSDFVLTGAARVCRRLAHVFNPPLPQLHPLCVWTTGTVAGHIHVIKPGQPL